MNFKWAANLLRIRFFMYLLLITTFSNSVFAQNSASRGETAKNELTVWAGGSFLTGSLVGKTDQVRLGQIGFRYARRFNNSDKVNLKYFVDVVPVTILSYPETRVVQLSANNFQIEDYRRNIYAAGAAPLGLQINFRPRKKYQPFINGSGGFLYFNQKTPAVGGTRFNFTADAGGGLEIKLKKQTAVLVGYKYHHISNGSRGFVNPGFDSNVFYVGYSFFK